MGKHLRVKVVLIREGAWRAWQRAIVERMLDVDGVTLVAVFAIGTLPPQPEREVPHGVPHYSLAVESRGDGTCMVDEPVATLLRSLGAEAIVNLSSACIVAPASCSEGALWLTHRGIAAMRELCAGSDVCEVALLRGDASGRHAILRSGAFATRGYTVAASAADIYRATQEWLIEALRALARGESLVAEPTEFARWRGSDRVAPRTSYRMRRAAHFIASKFRRYFRHEIWNVGVADRPIDSVAVAGRSGEAIRGVRWLPKLARGRFLADPFAIERDGALEIACEDYDYRSDKGVIAMIRLNGGLQIQTVLDEPFHLSYPFLVRDGGTTYAIPESHQARAVMLYEVPPFPQRWKRVATLIDGIAALDSSVVWYRDRWWLWCSDADRGSNHTLLLYWARDLRGPYVAHPRNPVKIDVRSARPGGTPFVTDGVLYRPAQDCSKTYGGRVVLNRVTALSEHEYAEEVVSAVGPDAAAYPDGLHTLAQVGSRVVVDGKRFMFAPSGFVRALRQRVSLPERASETAASSNGRR